MTAPLAHQVQIEIAGLRVSLALEHERVAQLLRQQYAAFSPRPGVEPLRELQASVHLEQPSTRASSSLTTNYEFRSSRLHFENPDYNGWLDSRLGLGELALTSVDPLADIDYFVRAAYALLVFHHGGLLFHSAGIVRGTYAFLFFGHSGSGKTTVSRLAGEGIVLNDDLLILMPEEERWMVYGTPFSNPTQVSPATSLACAPLGGLYRLVQDRTVYSTPMQPGQALAEMVSNVPIIPVDPGRIVPLLDRLRTVLDHVSAYYLHFLPDNSFWKHVVQVD